MPVVLGSLERINNNMDQPENLVELSRRLHEINVLDRTGNSRREQEAVEKLNALLKDAGVHMRCQYIVHIEEYVLQDTELNGREDEA